MASLPTLRPGAADTTGLPTTGSIIGNPGGSTALSDDSDSTFDGQNTNSSGTYQYGRALDDTPANFGSMDTLTCQLRYAWESAPTNSTWDTLSARIVASDGTTVLAALNSGGAFKQIATPGTTSTPTNSSVVGFDYVNTGATKGQWDGALIQVQWDRTRSKGGDSLGCRVYEGWIAGTYTTAALPPVDTTDTLDLTDAAATTIGDAQSDDLGLTDSFAVEIGYTLDLTDDLGLTDEIASQLPNDQTVDTTDATGLTDEGDYSDEYSDTYLARFVIDVALDRQDALGLTDAAAFDVALDQQNDLGLTDAAAFDVALDRQDDLGLTDSITVEVGFVRDYSDDLGLTDTAGEEPGEAHSDDLNLTDAITWQAELDRQDDLGLTDALDPFGTTVNATDDLGLTDSFTVVLDFGRDFTDDLDLTDSDERVWGAALDQTDNLGLTDSSTVEIGFTVDASDTLGLSDAFTTEIGYALDISDDLGLTDSASFDTSLTVDASDPLGLTDSFTTVRAVVFDVTDALGLTDSFDSDETTTLDATDPLGLTDSFTRDAIAYVRDYSDTLGLTDTLFAGVIPIESARFSLEPTRQATARSGSSIVNSRKHRRTLISREGR